jgi:hypothetical protein
MAQVEKKVSFEEAIVGTLSRANELCAMVETLADRLVGYHADESSDDQMVGQDSILGRVSEKATDTEKRIAEATRALEAINRVL